MALLHEAKLAELENAVSRSHLAPLVGLFITDAAERLKRVEACRAGGDYEAMGTIGSSFLPFFVQTNCTDSSCTNNPTDVYTGTF